MVEVITLIQQLRIQKTAKEDGEGYMVEKPRRNKEGCEGHQSEYAIHAHCRQWPQPFKSIKGEVKFWGDIKIVDPAFGYKADGTDQHNGSKGYSQNSQWSNMLWGHERLTDFIDSLVCHVSYLAVRRLVSVVVSESDQYSQGGWHIRLQQHHQFLILGVDSYRRRGVVLNRHRKRIGDRLQTGYGRCETGSDRVAQ